MKITTKFSALTTEVKNVLNEELKDLLSADLHEDFVQRVKPYSRFEKDQLDTIFLIVELTIDADVAIKELTPWCWVDQEDWFNYEDEPDIKIDSIDIPVKLISPTIPYTVSKSKSFWVVLQAEGNIWDSCKDLPAWVWDERKFDFMVTFNLVTQNGQKHTGNGGDEYARQLIKF